MHVFTNADMLTVGFLHCWCTTGHPGRTVAATASFTATEPAAGYDRKPAAALS